MRIEGSSFLNPIYGIDPRVKAQLDELGLKSTGNPQADLAAIKAALAKNPKKASNQNGQGMQPPKTPDEVAAFMQKLGLSPTNSKEGDHAAITGKIKELEAAAQTQAEKQNATSLKAEFQALIQSVESKGAPAMPQMIGAQQLAAMNKFFLVK